MHSLPDRSFADLQDRHGSLAVPTGQRRAKWRRAQIVLAVLALGSGCADRGCNAKLDWHVFASDGTRCLVAGVVSVVGDAVSALAGELVRAAAGGGGDAQWDAQLGALAVGRGIDVVRCAAGHLLEDLQASQVAAAIATPASHCNHVPPEVPRDRARHLLLRAFELELVKKKEASDGGR